MLLTLSQRSDLLAETKPHLRGSDIPDQPLLVQNLHQIASLAESFSEQRPRSNNWSHLADNLDQEGSEPPQYLAKFYLLHNDLLSTRSWSVEYIWAYLPNPSWQLGSCWCK